jgi:hypothetical protein
MGKVGVDGGRTWRWGRLEIIDATRLSGWLNQFVPVGYEHLFG